MEVLRIFHQAAEAAVRTEEEAAPGGGQPADPARQREGGGQHQGEGHGQVQGPRQQGGGDHQQVARARPGRQGARQDPGAL